MVMTRIAHHRGCYYREVRQITEFRDGCVYKTCPTGKYIHGNEEPLLPPGYLAVSLGMDLLRWEMEHGYLELDVVAANELKKEKTIGDAE